MSRDILAITFVTWMTGMWCAVNHYHELASIIFGFALAMALMIYFIHKDKP